MRNTSNTSLWAAPGPIENSEGRKNLTQDNNTDAVDAQEQSQSGEDSPVIKELRKQLKDMQKELKSMPSRSDIEAELRSQLEREQAVESQLVAHNVPTSIRSIVEEKLGDADPTAEAVVEALTALGFSVEDDGGASEDGEADGQAASDLAAVSDLSAKVRSTAKGGQPESDMDKISRAKSREELQAIASEAGFLQRNF
jgi:hypothetical protein